MAATMTAATQTSWWPKLDRFAIGLSGLCAVHCVATTALLALASTAGGMLLDPLIHEVGLTMAILLGAGRRFHRLSLSARLIPTG